MKTQIKLVIALLSVARIGFSQGFVNLDFESASIAGNVTGNEITATNAFPGWTVSAHYIYYDDTSLSGGSISIFDSHPPYSLPPIQGNYFAWLVGSGNLLLSPISIGQTGLVPAGTQSISFWGTDSGMQITFAGQPLNFIQTGSAANYNIYTADISAFAGQTGQLLFTVPLNADGGFLDNIQFSTSAVPEPSMFALTALGGLLLGFSRRKSEFNSPTINTRGAK